MKQRTEEIATISPLTARRASFVASMGYDVRLNEKGATRADDKFILTDETGRNFGVMRKNFYRWIAARHEVMWSDNNADLDAVQHAIGFAYVG